MDGGGSCSLGMAGGGSGFIWTEATSGNVPSGYSVPTKYYLTSASTTSGQREGNGFARITLIEGVKETIISEGQTVTKWKTIQGIIEEGILTGNFLWNGHTITVTDTNGETVVYGGKSENIQSQFPIPDGYVASQVEGENTKEDGLVIYEGTDPVTAENHATAMSSRNQYVWIPVDDINDMVMCSSNSGSSVCKLVLEGETLKCTTHTTTATDLVGRLYIGNSSNTTEGSNRIYSYIMDFSKRDQTYNTSNYCEPAVVSSDSNYSVTINQLKQDFTAMATSVAKNGGFYISRYEVGENGDSKKNQKVLTAYSSNGSNFLGVSNWYGLYNTIRKINKNKQMIWGCQYDQVIKFIGEESQIGHTDRNLTDFNELSGKNESDKMKNIYDLESNHNEWTLEYQDSDGTTARVFRGGDWYDKTFNIIYPASYRNAQIPTGTASDYSSRSTLYIGLEEEQIQEPISKTQSYVGYYADVDGDKQPDGIIYADFVKCTYIHTILNSFT